MTPPAWITAVYLLAIAVVLWFAHSVIDDGEDDE